MAWKEGQHQSHPITSPGHLSKGQSRPWHTCKAMISQRSDSSRGAAGTLLQAKVVPWASECRHKWGISEVNSLSLWKGIIRNGRGGVEFHPACPTPCLNGKSQNMLLKLHFNEFPQQRSLEPPEMEWAECPSWAGWEESHPGHLTKDISIPPLLRESEQWPQNGKRTQTQQWQKHCCGGCGVTLTPSLPTAAVTQFGHGFAFHFPCYYQKFHPSKNTSCHKEQRGR